jgi:hypothetical protein
VVELLHSEFKVRRYEFESVWEQSLCFCLSIFIVNIIMINVGILIRYLEFTEQALSAYFDLGNRLRLSSSK